MNCPACAQPLAPSRSRCPYCGLVLIQPVEGALAPEPKPTTPPPRPQKSPASREREKNWRDEVRLRVQRRRQYRGHDVDMTEAIPETSADAADQDMEDQRDVPSQVVSDTPSISEPFDLALQPRDELAPRLDIADEQTTSAIDWSLGDEESAPAERPVERPATALERFKAALLDSGLLAGLWTVVVYFAAKAARTPIPGLWPAWIPLAAYLGFLGMMYATYFTGTSGSTPGKAFLGLKVVNTLGRPPTYARSFLRALLGAVGVLCGCIGLVPVLLDPARRALHDQLLRTRVVKR